MNEDIEKQLEEIYNHTNYIYSLYTMLSKMEILGRQNTKKYESLVQLLFLAIEDEKYLYIYFLNIFESIKDITDVNTFLLNNAEDIEDFDNVDLIINQNPLDLIKKRVCYRYFNCILEKLREDDYTSDNETETISSYLEKIEKTLYTTTNVRLASYLEDVIKVATIPAVKNDLIHARLYLSFLDSYLEEQYLKYGFHKVPNIFDEELEIEGDNRQNLSKKMQESHGINLLIRATNELFCFDEDDFKDPLIYFESIILSGLIQTSTLYLSDSLLKVLQQEIYSSLEDLKRQGNFADDSYVENILDLAFSSVDEIKRQANSDSYGSKQY